jgi:copper chaperone CopZ
MALVLAVALGFPAVASAKKVTRTFTLGGARTTRDEQKIESAVTRVPGVASATTRRNAVTITYDDRRVTPVKLRAAVHAAGKRYHLGAPAQVAHKLPRKKVVSTHPAG